MVGLYIILIFYVILSIFGFIVMVGTHRVTQDKIDDLKEHLSYVQTRIDDINDQKESDTDAEDEETLEKQAVNVFSFVDEVLDGKKELEDFYNEEQQDI